MLTSLIRAACTKTAERHSIISLPRVGNSSLTVTFGSSFRVQNYLPLTCPGRVPSGVSARSAARLFSRTLPSIGGSAIHRVAPLTLILQGHDRRAGVKAELSGKTIPCIKLCHLTCFCHAPPRSSAYTLRRESDLRTDDGLLLFEADDLICRRLYHHKPPMIGNPRAISTLLTTSAQNRDGAFTVSRRCVCIRPSN